MKMTGNPWKIDLHMHSTVSDGTDSPAEILDHVREADIGIFSLTDHDAIKGCAALRGLFAQEDSGNPAFVNGVEFSCRDEEGKYHILGYGYDPDAEAISAILKKGHGFRMNKVRARLDFIKREFGFNFPPEEISALLAMDNPGKPHIGNLMVRYGYAKTKEEAIRDYIDQLHFKSEYVRPDEAIAAISESGGIPVLAHPFFGSGGQLILGEDMEARLRRLMDFGLRGVEAFYSGFTPKLTGEMLALAERYVLYVTAGSDYHGTNKLVQLGDTGPEEERELPAGLENFLKAVL